jgi:protein-S-isoprenylcysteine O-methyltransferase Ste14
MDPLTMLQTAAVLLVLTAVGGAAMALQRMAKRTNPPNWLAMAHGLLAAAALTLLIYAAVADEIPMIATAGVVLLVVAAAGGMVMNLFYHLKDKLLPQWLLHLHIALAVLGSALVLWGAWGPSA